MLGLPGEGKPLLRAYSIASPAYAEELEFLSIKVPDGPLTSRLAEIREGEVRDLAFREELESLLANDVLVQDQALVQLSYLPTVTREPFRTTGRIDAHIESGLLFEGVGGQHRFDPETDRIMMCGSMAMIRDLAACFDRDGFAEGSNAKPGHYVIERAFVD